MDDDHCDRNEHEYDGRVNHFDMDMSYARMVRTASLTS
jgi:hypothetical protein